MGLALTIKNGGGARPVDGIAADAPMWPDFEEGWKVSRVLDAIALSHREGRWLNVNDIV